MEELRKFQSSTFDTIARRKLVEDQNTILELSGRIQELQNEIHCMSDSKEFQDAKSIRTFLQIQMRHHQHLYPQELNQWSSSIEEPLHSSTVEKSERQEQDQDLRCLSGPSAKNSVIFSGGDPSKNYGADQQRLQISELHFDKFPTPATFACWKIRFKTEVCTCSQFPTEAMQWIKELEMVDSVDDLGSSSSTRAISMPNFEVLDARIASALNKIIHNSQLKEESIWRNKRPRSRTDSFAEDRLLT